MGGDDTAADELLTKLGSEVAISDADVALREIGWGLVYGGQQLLADTSSEDDVELFFEVYGYPNDEPPKLWVDRIVAGMSQRLSAEDVDGLVDTAVRRAATKLRDASV